MQDPVPGWVKFETLKPGAKFHNMEGIGWPVQYIKLQSDTGTYAVNTDNGLPVTFHPDQFVYPVDNGWIAELSCYGYKKEVLEKEMERGGHRAVVTYVMNRCEARKRDWAWRKEIERYFPQLAIMSFSGPSSTIKWLMDRVMPIEEDAQLANKLTAIEASDLPADQKARARLEAIFPNLRGDADAQSEDDPMSDLQE